MFATINVTPASSALSIAMRSAAPSTRTDMVASITGRGAENVSGGRASGVF
jgi:hypothetical protein